MRMGQGVRTGLGHGGITCVLQTQFASFSLVGLNIEISSDRFRIRCSTIFVTHCCTE